jgi:hypothetical protein
MRRLCSYGLVGFATALFFTVNASAESLLFGYTTFDAFDYADRHIIAGSCFDISSSTTQAQCQGTYNFSQGMTGLFSEQNHNATAQADFGVLKVFAQSDINLTSTGSRARPIPPTLRGLPPFATSGSSPANPRGHPALWN